MEVEQKLEASLLLDYYALFKMHAPLLAYSNRHLRLDPHGAHVILNYECCAPRALGRMLSASHGTT